ncbi:MAG: pyridoxamine 5'-phosphate oxidase [Magnetovibrio sp.]|nr:pyridoxamine 5'-phosphate oxidase [Magnetovibrio sp.]|tara:strand:+ start:696 stop:1283 length:588 start_codon:yes stop_codon:yes gene_type:complete
MANNSEDPIALFSSWFAEAKKMELENPNAMMLATAQKGGQPSARMVLMKEFNSKGFVFYTNLGSRKGLELDENPLAALVFYWKSLARQVRIEGKVELVSDREADEYHKTRPRLSQIGAWASKQSEVIEGPFALEKQVAKYTTKFKIGSIPRPKIWSGFRLLPASIEFWQEAAFRLHDRRLFTRIDSGWSIEKLYP